MINSSKSVGWAIVAVGALSSVTAFAQGWGPIGRSAIVTTAAHVVSRDLTFPLMQFEQYISEGAGLTEEELYALYPNAAINPTRAIEEEIYLLQAIRTNRIDPYFAYRLGALGQLVANAVAPMATAAPEYRQRYFKDAEQYIRNTEMNTTARRTIDATYFPERMRRASAQDDTIEVDYRSGSGFAGLALASLSTDASRAVNAVADTYYTIIIAPVSRLNVSHRDMQNYALNALGYYLRNDKILEADSAVSAVFESGAVTPDVERRIADVYFEAEHFNTAIRHYESVLAADPTQRQVAIRIAQYYEGLGDESASEKALEDARDAYARAAAADSLNEEAHRKLFTAERSIEARDARLESAKTAIELAQDYQSEAEKAKLSRNFVEALANLREAKAQYESITSEFPDQARDAARGIRLIDVELKEMREDLVGNVRRLSGSGYQYTARRLGRITPGVEAESFKALQQIELNTALDALSEAEGRKIESLR